MVKYYLQEIPEVLGGDKKKVYPKMLTNRQISTKELVERIQMKSGVFREGIVNGMLMALADTLVDYLSLGYTVKIDGLCSLSVSLEFDDNKPTEMEGNEDKMKYRHVKVKDINFKSDKMLVKALSQRMTFERCRGGVNRINRSAYSKAERIERAVAFIKENGSISLYQYCALNNLSRATASRELKAECRKSDSPIDSYGAASHKVWVLRKMEE